MPTEPELKSLMCRWCGQSFNILSCPWPFNVWGYCRETCCQQQYQVLQEKIDHAYRA